ncbi:MAG: right-handed parallel beta-helix repeat-containing protein [Planctomycetes bacterium]|nr:right-handed parallel beta-helix repeat-containing protein [Planctomycetota bacterium]
MSIRSRTLATRPPVLGLSAGRARFAALAIALCFASAGSAWAGDWYVDPLVGDDANGGTNPTDAWRTISHALATAPAAPAGGTQTIHLAPGSYDGISGEVFPLELRDAFELVGDGGPDITVLDGGGDARMISAWSSDWIGVNHGPLTLVKGLTLQNAYRGVEVMSSSGTEYLTIQDCRVLDVNGTGILVVATCGLSGCGSTDVKLDRVEVRNCEVGVFVNSGHSQAPAKLTVIDCEVVECSSHGIIEGDAGGGAELELLRTRIHGSGGEGLWLIQDNVLTPNMTHAKVTDCLISSNAGAGIKAEVRKDNLTNSRVDLGVVRSTIADNHYGVEAFCPTGWSPDIFVSLSGAIVYGNLDDVYENPAHVAFTTVRFCDIGDGDFAGSLGNFAADPLFVDPSNLDYRLRWASPCIETGDWLFAAGTLDLAHNARPIDGDFDTLERFDVGCYEFAPLFQKSIGKLGSPLALELWGPQGNATTVYFTRKPLVAGQPTPFGELDLDAAFMNVFRVTTVGSGPPKTIKRTIPNDPAFAGLVFSFQALTECAAAPQGKAYTNAVELTLVP